MNETSHVDQTTEQTDLSKAEVSAQTGVDTIPETIKQLLSVPPLLPHQNEEAFLELFESFRN